MYAFWHSVVFHSTKRSKLYKQVKNFIRIMDHSKLRKKLFCLIQYKTPIETEIKCLTV